MKPLKPSHRERKRYLLIKGEEANKENIEKAILDYIGVLGYSKTGLQFVKSSKNCLIIAIDRQLLNDIRASFLIFGKKIVITKVSGSIKNLKQ